MHVLQAVLVLLYSLMLWYEVRVGLVEYAAFMLLTDTSERQRYYRRWLLRSLLCFSGSAVAGLVIVGRLRALASLPADFTEISLALHRSLPDIHLSLEFFVAFGISLCVGAVLGGVIAAKLAKRGRSMVAGNVEPLMPRNWPETAYTFLLSLNAGLGEELLFRLFLPLLLTLLFGNAIVSFLVTGVVFGLMHVYQGVRGIVLTMFIGFVFTVIYLASGSIWISVAIHAGIDVLGLVVRPTALRLLGSRRLEAPAEAR